MMSSLQNKCRVKVLVEILNHPHLKKEIFCSPIKYKNFEERDVALRRAVSDFLKDFHYVLKEFIPKHLILFIGFEMWKWAEYQKQHFDFSFKFSENFIRSSLFTSEGLIDEEKAARRLLIEPNLSNFLKYSIACQYFLEDVIPSLWQTLQKNERNFRKMLKEHKSRVPMILWSNYLKKKNSASILNQKVITRRFKIRVFSYGLKHKNIAAVKFSLSPKGRSGKNKTEATIIRKLVYKSFCDYVRPFLRELNDSVIINFSTKFLADCNIIIYFISLLNKRELRNFFFNEDLSFEILIFFLLWPFQNQFMYFAEIFYETCSASNYNELMFQILAFIEEQNNCEPYSYRLLLREFWVKSPPHMKKEIIDSESESIFFSDLITIIFNLENFTSDDLDTVNLILEYANSDERQNILLNQGKSILKILLVYYDRFGVADSFLKNLDLNQETLQTLKHDFVFDSFLEIMEKQNIDLVDKIFKWIVGSDDIEDFKEEIFQRLILSDKIEHFFLDFKEKAPFSFLNKIIRWFLKTDERIEECKNNIIYSPLIGYSNPHWFDQFLKYKGHSHEEASIIKKEILFGNLPDIAKRFMNYANIRVLLDRNIFSLCSHKKEKFREFTDHLRSFYEDSIKEKMCLLCLNNNLVLGDGEEEQLFCDNHGTNGFISLNEVDRICLSLQKRFHNLFCS